MNNVHTNMGKQGNADNQVRTWEYATRRKSRKKKKLLQRFGGLKKQNENRFNRFFAFENNTSYPVFGFSKMLSGAHL